VNSSVNGGFIEFRDVDGGAGGRKILRVRTALASGSRTGRLVVNGTARSVTFASTGSWTTWTQTDLDVQLDSHATNTLRFESTGQDLANIDQLEIR
jgi:rhamnogalacturonan endolyase